MALADLTDWLDDFTGPSIVWYVKRLSGNDTLANGSHQAGPYIPRSFLFDIFPAINRTDIKNPDLRFDVYIDSHADHRTARAIYYNNKFHENPKGGRNEARITGFGGGSSALLDPESTGALTVFAFVLDDTGAARECHVWVCRHETEEDLVEDRIGPVEPGKWAIWSPDLAAQPSLFQPQATPRARCWLDPGEIPPSWLTRFPTGAEIIRKAVELRGDTALDPDHRLIRRRDCEFEIFRSVEEAVELPGIRAGFTAIDDFISRAQSILQRRKSRSGRSLELHAREIFIEERLREDLDFAHGPESDPGRRPDFLFPSQTAYRNPAFPSAQLRMLAVKTTCKDRWRQILNEADRIPVKHLLTLQEGVSEGQFREMTEAGVQLVVPVPLVSSFPKSVQPHLQSFESFIGDVRLLAPAGDA
ncbi:type II restriction endonuclease [Aquamicrobium defluvii]|uniref:Type-2 restriction enzyme EcoRII n=1 Tax=Aquamicrobium defluvii TaxID=69279 RepID=A0A011U286_9HYPH|nr:type II restriction endonuclease [Aquamicrobium defluvii]EXL10552.1 type-2 restriction enzyme EcoRII [Aquamicrobium defluvii]EZQ17729.1 type-2 restriction enzyme EcoRII [Halopseudomonas bauzanensis]